MRRPLGAAERDAGSHIPKTLLFPPRRLRGAMALPPSYDERGRCPMVVDGRFSIYERRLACAAPTASSSDHRSGTRSARRRRAVSALALRTPVRRRPSAPRGAGRRTRAVEPGSIQHSPRRPGRRSVTLTARGKRGGRRQRRLSCSQDSPVSKIWPMRMALPNPSWIPRSMPQFGAHLPSAPPTGDPIRPHRR